MTKIGFNKLSSQLAANGASNPDALAAYIGRQKFGAKGMAAKAAAGARHHHGVKRTLKGN